jgi:hypothetical protein
VYASSICLKALDYISDKDIIKVISKLLNKSFDRTNNIKEHDKVVRQLVFDAKYKYVSEELKNKRPSEVLDALYAEASKGNESIKLNPLYRAMVHQKDHEIRTLRYILKTNQ